MSAFALAVLVSAPLAQATTNHRPTISWIPDQRITSGSFANKTFTIGDAETAAGSLSVSVVSSNTTWFPAGNLTVSGTAPNLTASFGTPGTTGSATITVTVTDAGGKTSATAFTLQKANAGTAPEIAGIPNQTFVKGGSFGPLPFVIKDDDSSESSMTPTAVSSNTTLLPNGNITLGGQNYGRTISATPNATQSGRDVITVSVSDGTNSTSTAFVVDVIDSATNSAAPSISVPGYQILGLGGTPTGLSFTVSDSQTPVADLLVTAHSSNQALVTDANIALSGTTGTRTVTITPQTGVTGASTITLSVDDGDIVRSAQLLFIVRDNGAAARSLPRSNGVFILDGKNGTQYTPSITIPASYLLTGGKAYSRDGNIRSTTAAPFATGYVFRISWDQVEDATTAGTYDFQIIDNIFSKLPAGQQISFIIMPAEPAYIASHSGVTTWNDGGTLRAVPWDPYLQSRRQAFAAALADHTVGGVALSVHPSLVAINPYLPGGTTGIRDPSGTHLRDMSGYSRPVFLSTVTSELELWQDNFPGKVVQIGFWAITDYEDGNYMPPISAHDYIRGQLLTTFNGTNRPQVGFFMENLAATRPGPTIDPYSFTPVTAYALDLYAAVGTTWNSFQMLDAWAKPSSDAHVDNTFNGQPVDAMEAAYNTYDSQYSEVYIGDIDTPAYQAGFQLWHDYLATTAAPRGVLPAPVSSTEIDLTWTAVSGATGYSVRRQAGTGAFSTVASSLTSASFNDTGLTPGTRYTYQVNATTANGTTAWSASFPASTESTTTLLSRGTEDGYVTTTSADATITGATGLRAGEGAASQQKAVVSFDSTLPAGAVVKSARLRLKQSCADTNFTTLGTCMVDIMTGDFGGSATLASGDFSATATATNVASVPSAGLNGWAEITLSPTTVTQINTGGHTQFRIYFNHLTGHPNTNITWYPGENSGNEPQLVLEYTP